MVFDSLKIKNRASNIVAAGPAAPKGEAPTKKSIFQSRVNCGVNLGSAFVLEPFMFGSFFVDGTPAEFEAVSRQIEKKGENETRDLIRNHHDDFMSRDDWSYLKEKNVKAVRIPVGYWCVDNGKFTKGTPFEKVASVYSGAWDSYKKYIEQAGNFDIGVLVDLHALPGGANTGDHSGIKLDKPGFWDSSSNQKLALDILEFVAGDLKGFENIAGIQIVNESEFSDSASKQKSYYSAAIATIRKVDQTVPIVISDGWWPNQWVEWVLEEEKKVGGALGVSIDTHTYRCFSDSDKQKHPQQIIKDLDGDVLTNLSGKVDFLCGEFSCVLDGQSWDKCGKDERPKLVQEFGQEQTKLFLERATSGWYFWTYKFENGDGGEWGFKPMSESGSLYIPPHLENLPSRDDFENTLESRFKEHSDYWNGQSPGEKYEHDRYKDGFTTAWKDSEEFAKYDSLLGRVHAWMESRKYEHTRHRGDSKYAWEWDEGFKRGLEEFKKKILDIN